MAFTPAAAQHMMNIGLAENSKDAARYAADALQLIKAGEVALVQATANCCSTNCRNMSDSITPVIKQSS